MRVRVRGVARINDDGVNRSRKRTQLALDIASGGDGDEVLRTLRQFRQYAWFVKYQNAIPVPHKLFSPSFSLSEKGSAGRDHGG